VSLEPSETSVKKGWGFSWGGRALWKWFHVSNQILGGIELPHLTRPWPEVLVTSFLYAFVFTTLRFLSLRLCKCFQDHALHNLNTILILCPLSRPNRMLKVILIVSYTRATISCLLGLLDFPKPEVCTCKHFRCSKGSVSDRGRLPLAALIPRYCKPC
jgi:hypothetical protein